MKADIRAALILLVSLTLRIFTTLLLRYLLLYTVDSHFLFLIDDVGIEWRALIGEVVVLLFLIAEPKN